MFDSYGVLTLLALYSELTKTSTALARLAVLSVLSAARRLVLIFVNPLYLGGIFGMAKGWVDICRLLWRGLSP